MTQLAVLPAHDPQLEQLWRRLEHAAAPSYERTWGFLETWLAEVPRDAAVLYDGAVPVAACLLGRDPGAVHVEALVRVPGSAATLAELVQHLPGDEHVLDDISRSALAELAPLGDRYQLAIEHEATLPFVDLDAVRAAPGGYLALIAPTVRAQIIHHGEVAIDVAADRDHALAIYDELCRLRGDAGEPLDRRLIEARLPHGEIELMRVTGDAGTVGCLMCVVSRGRVACWREGRIDPRAGYLCHAAAIAHHAARGMASYELADDHLATGTSSRVSLRVRRAKRVPSVVRA